MSQTLLEMAKELVLAQIQAQQVAPEAMQGALNSTYETQRSLEAAEAGGGNGHSEAAGERLAAQAPVDWKKSITKHSIRCLECGDTFKQLSLRHLSVHSLDLRLYRDRYNIPRSQALSARNVTARRRELAPSKTQSGAKATKPKGQSRSDKARSRSGQS